MVDGRTSQHAGVYTSQADHWSMVLILPLISKPYHCPDDCFTFYLALCTLIHIGALHIVPHTARDRRGGNSRLHRHSIQGVPLNCGILWGWSPTNVHFMGTSSSIKKS